MYLIKTENLTKNYGKARGITNLNLNVKQGDFYGFIGPNGAGKSTTIRTMLGLIKPTSGSVNIFGMEMPTSKIDILSKIGYIPSESMFYNMKVKDVLSLSNRLRGIESDFESDKLCKIFELDLEKKVQHLSFGNRKKVSIVSALAHNPELYILDEPTGGLDPLIQRTFFEILSDRHKQGATVFLSSHILSEVQTYCKSAGIIKEGELIADDTVANLTSDKIKKVELRSHNTIGNIKGVSNLEKIDDRMTFLFNGEVKELLHMLNDIDITDITINEPTLEETFMHFYERKEG